MKALHSSPVFLMLAATALSGSCGSNSDATAGAAGSIVAGPGGIAGSTGGNTAGVGGAAAGGTATGGGALPGGASGALAGGVVLPPASGSGVGGTGAVTREVDAPCEKKVRTAGKTIPDFMIVLDRSSSMLTTVDPTVRCDGDNSWLDPNCLTVDCTSPQWMKTTACGGMDTAGVDRWHPAVAALKSLTAMFEAKVNFGLTIFPGPGADSGDNCSTGTQRVAVGPKNAAAIGAALDSGGPAGYTPTSTTLDLVYQQIQAKMGTPDQQVPPQYVLLVTDGSPNCVDQSNPLALLNDPMAVQATIAAIDKLAKIGVKTFVIGYDASVDAMLAANLTQFAQHGGTNNFFAVQDGPSLVAQFTSITSVLAECSYLLDMKPGDPTFVNVELDQKQLKLNDPDGWVITDRNVTIQGNACTTLRDGSKPHTLAVTVECTPQILK